MYILIRGICLYTGNGVRGLLDVFERFLETRSVPPSDGGMLARVLQAVGFQATPMF
jgi:hypothetical protein